jgi:hypothetical protein
LLFLMVHHIHTTTTSLSQLRLPILRSSTPSTHPTNLLRLSRSPSPAYVQLQLVPEAHCMALAIWTISKQAHVAEIYSLHFTRQFERSRNLSASSSRRSIHDVKPERHHYQNTLLTCPACLGFRMPCTPGKHLHPPSCLTKSGPFTNICFFSEVTNLICRRAIILVHGRTKRYLPVIIFYSHDQLFAFASNCHLESPLARNPTPLRTILNHFPTPSYPLSPLYFPAGTSSIAGIRLRDRSELLLWRHEMVWETPR